MHRVARLFVAAALVAPLGGCAVFEAIVSGLAEVAAGPRIVYATDPVDPDTPPFFGAVALTDDDAGLPIARKSLPFYGAPLRLRLSPDDAQCGDRRAGSNHARRGAPAECGRARGAGGRRADHAGFRPVFHPLNAVFSTRRIKPIWNHS